MKHFLLLFSALILVSCSTENPKPVTGKTPVSKVAIDQFYAPVANVAAGAKAQLCYGVSGAKSVALAPNVEEVWPAVSRCFDVHPKASTTYTLTATSDDGSTVKKTVTVSIGPAAPPKPKIHDIWASSVDMQAGQPLRICFQTENATRVTVSAGKFDAAKNCINDNPMQSTSYKIAVFGAAGEPALGQVDVKVHP